MKTKSTVYKSGLAFDKTLARNLDSLITRVEGNKASLMIIDGGVGEGKTTLAIECVDYINDTAGLPPTTLENKNHPQLALGGKDFTKQFRKCYELKLPAIIYDEAGDFNRRGSLTRFNNMINRTFETFRGFKIVVILVLPSFNVIDNSLYEKNIPRLLLHTKGRNNKYGNYFGYSLVAMNWVRFWADKLPKGIKYKCYDKVNPNFKGHFKNIAPVRSTALDRISTQGKLEVLKASEIKLEGLTGYKDLATKVGRSAQWVRTVMNEGNIKPARIINQKKYFKEEIIDWLLDRMDNSQRRGLK